MSGNKLLLDTNIVLYLLGSEEVANSLTGKKIAVSEISEMELLSFPRISIAEEQVILRFLNTVKIIPLTSGVKQKAIEMRRKYKFKLPDAIICATAIEYDLLLVTNDLALHKIEELTVIGLEDLSNDC